MITWSMFKPINVSFTFSLHSSYSTYPLYCVVDILYGFSYRDKIPTSKKLINIGILSCCLLKISGQEENCGRDGTAFSGNFLGWLQFKRRGNSCTPNEKRKLMCIYISQLCIYGYVKHPNIYWNLLFLYDRNLEVVWSPSFSSRVWTICHWRGRAMEKNPCLVSDLRLPQHHLHPLQVYRFLHQTCHQKLLLMEILLKNPPTWQRMKLNSSIFLTMKAHKIYKMMISEIFKQLGDED